LITAFPLEMILHHLGLNAFAIHSGNRSLQLRSADRERLVIPRKVRGSREQAHSREVACCLRIG